MNSAALVGVGSAVAWEFLARIEGMLPYISWQGTTTSSNKGMRNAF